jgi:hypothetical protein
MVTAALRAAAAFVRFIGHAIIYTAAEYRAITSQQPQPPTPPPTAPVKQ